MSARPSTQAVSPAGPRPHCKMRVMIGTRTASGPAAGAGPGGGELSGYRRDGRAGPGRSNSLDGNIVTLLVVTQPMGLTSTHGSFDFWPMLS